MFASFTKIFKSQFTTRFHLWAFAVLPFSGCMDKSSHSMIPDASEQHESQHSTLQKNSPSSSSPDAGVNHTSEPPSLRGTQEDNGNQAPALFIESGKAIVSPFSIEQGTNRLALKGRNGMTLDLWKFEMYGSHGPQENIPEFPKYITEHTSWEEIHHKKQANFTTDYFNLLVHYIACRYSQDDGELELLRQVRTWPFVAEADWEAGEYSDKPFLHIVSKAGDTYEYYTNWGNPENLKNPAWRDFSKPTVWGPPNFKDLCDGLHGHGKIVDEAFQKYLNGELSWLHEFMKDGGIYVRTDEQNSPTWWLEGDRISHEDYQKMHKILSDTKDKNSRNVRLYDVKSLGYPEIQRDKQELKAINELIRVFDDDPKIRDWFMERAKGRG